MRCAVAVVVVVVVVIVIAAACGGHKAEPASDQQFLAARAAAEQRVLALFAENVEAIAPHPEAAGPTDPPDPRDFAAAGTVVLPAATPVLARCHATTAAALAAFAAIHGPALGEGMMGKSGLNADGRRREINRQGDSIAAAYCLWRTAAQACHDAVPAIAVFEPRFLDCK